MRGDELTRRHVVEAALLHDIGKVIQRAMKASGWSGAGERSLTHQEFGYEWGRHVGLAEPTLQAMLRHHKLRPDHPKYEKLSYDRYGGSAALRNLIAIVYEADNLASAMERLESGADTPTEHELHRGMGVVFDRIALDDEHHGGSSDAGWKGRTANGCRHVWSCGLVEDRPFPVPADDERENRRRPSHYAEIWDGLRRALEHPFNRTEDRLLLLLEKYLSFVPETTISAEGEQPDTSLYHHLKATAAVASSLFVRLRDGGADFDTDLERVILDRNEERYLLVGADLSGIQDFVYTIGSKAALKTLRGRSFYLDLLMESVAVQLLEGLGLGRVHLVYATAGTLLLLVPDTERIRRGIEEFTEGFNRWLFREFRSKLYLAVESVALSGRSLDADAVSAKGMGEEATLAGALKTLHGRLGSRKTVKWKEMLEKDGGFLFTPTAVARECDVCRSHEGVDAYVVGPHLRPAAEDAGEGERHELCRFCAQMIRLGQVLPRADRFYECVSAAPTEGPGDSARSEETARRTGPSAIRLEVWKKSYWIATPDFSPNTDLSGAKVLAEYRMREPWSLPQAGDWAVRPFPTGAFLAEPEFVSLAQRACGDARLGVLVMDVDRLGAIFARGLTPQTLGRLSDLSARLNLFFKYYLPAMFEEAARGERDRLLPRAKEEYAVNLVYAGGDDLLLVGAWDDAFDAAFAVWSEFCRYVGRNPDVTLSAGIAVVDERAAFYRAVEEAKKEEKNAKKDGRDRLGALGLTLQWRDVAGEEGKEGLKKILNHFAQALEQNDRTIRPTFMSVSFFRQYAAIVERAGKDLGHWFAPQLHYVVGRKAGSEKNEDRKKFYYQLVNFALNDVLRGGPLVLALRILQILMRRRSAE